MDHRKRKPGRPSRWPPVPQYIWTAIRQRQLGVPQAAALIGYPTRILYHRAKDIPTRRRSAAGFWNYLSVLGNNGKKARRLPVNK